MVVCLHGWYRRRHVLTVEIFEIEIVDYENHIADRYQSVGKQSYDVRERVGRYSEKVL